MTFLQVNQAQIDGQNSHSKVLSSDIESRIIKYNNTEIGHWIKVYDLIHNKMSLEEQARSTMWGLVGEADPSMH